MRKAREYWAALPTDEVGDAIMERVDHHYDQARVTGFHSQLTQSYRAYYGLSQDGSWHASSAVGEGGEQGELALLKVNHFRNLLRHIFVMTTSQKLAFETKAINTDPESQAQAILGNDLLEYYQEHKNLGSHLDRASELALPLGEAWCKIDWDPRGGDVYGVHPETQMPVYEGDVKYSALGPLDVIRDESKSGPDDHDWYISREWRNRFDLAARYPDKAEKILDLECKHDRVGRYNWQLVKSRGGDLDSDDVPVYTFYRDRSDAMPNGRLVRLSGGDVVYTDTGLPYRELPLYRIAPGEMLGTPFGYTEAFDLLSLQEALDSLASIVLSNQQAFGVSNVLVPDGFDVTLEKLAQGLNAFKYDASLPNGRPEVLNLTQTPPEVFQFLELIERWMETISGVNSVARGNPESSLKSGAALALVQSMAIQYASGYQKSYVKLASRVATGTLRLLRDFATVPRIAMIAGKDNASMMRNFSGKDLAQIDRVIIDMGNPLSKTTAGRLQIADSLLQNQKLDTPEEYLQVLSTGKLDPLIQAERAELMLIKEENQKLALGEQVKATRLEKHSLHIREHRSVIASMDAKNNAQVVAAVEAHVEEHVAFLIPQKPTDGALLQIIGEQPLPPPGAPPPPANDNGGPPAKPANDNGGGAGPVMEPTTGQPMPNMPRPPTNPLTGEKADLPTLGPAA